MDSTTAIDCTDCNDSNWISGSERYRPASSLMTFLILRSVGSIRRTLPSLIVPLNASVINGRPSLSHITCKLIGLPAKLQLNVALLPMSATSRSGSMCTTIGEMTINLMLTFSSPTELLAEHIHLPEW